jgi:hypothetical protein
MGPVNDVIVTVLGRRAEDIGGVVRSCQYKWGTSAMDSLPPWALWIIAAAVGLSPGLALLMVGEISRFLHPIPWPRGSKGSPWFGPEGVRAELAIAIPPM